MLDRVHSGLHERVRMGRLRVRGNTRTAGVRGFNDLDKVALTVRRREATRHRSAGVNVCEVSDDFDPRSPCCDLVGRCDDHVLLRNGDV
jgi:hypothetical protein